MQKGKGGIQSARNTCLHNLKIYFSHFSLKQKTKEKARKLKVSGELLLPVREKHSDNAQLLYSYFYFITAKRSPRWSFGEAGRKFFLPIAQEEFLHLDATRL